MHILIVPDAWLPQINGVVRTIEIVGRELEKLGHRVEVIDSYVVPHTPKNNLSGDKLEG